MYLISGLNWSGVIRDPHKNNQESSVRKAGHQCHKLKSSQLARNQR